MIPAPLRKALGLKDGDRLIARLDNGTLRILPATAAVAEAQEVVRRYVDPDRNLVEELLAERRRDADDG